MFTNKYILLSLLILTLIETGCIPFATPTFPTTQPEPTVTPIQQQPTSTVFIGMPPVFNPLIQAENESVEEFVVRIAAAHISYSRPVLVVLSRLKVESTVLYGVPSGLQDVQRCWFYETDSSRTCTSEDLEKYFSDPKNPKIFFAFVYSNSEKSLFLIEHFYDGDEYYSADSYRLVLELKDGKWVEKSILSVWQ
jgi:hypothetical protein